MSDRGTVLSDKSQMDAGYPSIRTLGPIAGGGCIILSVMGYTLILAYAALIIAVLVAVFRVM